ncbi:MAG: carbohydrate-binding domain-containing protein, partial [Clostridia bacterium]|nr:carbohydrate-binding domain-containing protein [Clostridia bacterium]
MKIWKQTAALTAALGTLLTLASCGFLTGSERTTGSGETYQNPASYDAETPEALSDPESEEEEAAGDFTIVTEDGTVSREGSVWILGAAGEYRATGNLEEGQIVIRAGEEDEVVLILAGASISSSAAAPIRVESAKEATVKAEEGTYNTVNDLRAGAEVEENAAIYSSADLHLSGKGTLIVTSTYSNGIKSKDDLTVKNLTLTVTSPGVALKGNDSVTVKSGGLILISTGADGIKTANSDLSSQ